MNRQQILVVASAFVLFFLLYFGCDTQSREQKTLEKARVLTAESLDIQSVAQKALIELEPSARTIIQPLTEKAKSEPTPSVLKQLSGAWHDAKRDDIAAWYAEQVAEIEKTDEAWSIAGANYVIALQNSSDKTARSFCAQRASEAFQNAVSLNPSKIEHKINAALVFTEEPPADNPMKGTLQLLDLERANPGNVPVNLQLARLGIRTAQFDKAIARLEKILNIEPNNQRAICLLADAYSGSQNPKAQEFLKRCQAQ